MQHFPNLTSTRRPRGKALLIFGFLLLLAVPGSAQKLKKPGKRPPKDSNLLQGKAEDVLKTLQARFQEKADPERLRQDLLALGRTFPGTQEAVAAAGMLNELPSPLAKLDARAIPPLERYDWQPKGLVAVLGEHRGRQGSVVTCVAYSPNGKLVVSGGNNSLVRFWDPTTLRLKAVMGHDNPVTALAFSKDSRTLAASSVYGTVRLWDVSADKPKLLHVIKASTGALHGVDFAPNGRKIACCGADLMVRLWDISGKEPKEWKVVSGHTKLVSALAFSKSGRTLVSGDYAGGVRLWKIQVDDVKAGASWDANTKEITAVAFDPSGQYLAVAGYDGTARLWSLGGSGQKLWAALPLKAGVIYGLAFTPGGKQLALAGQDNNLHVWSLAGARSRELYLLKGHESYVTSVAYSKDGRSLVSGSGDWTVRNWNVAGRRPVPRYVPRGHLSFVHAVRFSPDGKMIASGSEDKTARLWDLAKADFKQSHLLKGTGYQVYSVAFSPDGKNLAGGGPSNTVWLWHTVSGREIKRLTAFPGGIGSLAFTPDGNKVLCVSLKDVCLWDARTGKKIRLMQGHTTNISSVALSPDGRRALSCAGYYLYKDGKIVTKNNVPVYTDCTLRLWDVSSGRLVHSFTSFERPVTHAAFAPDGSQAASGDWQNNVRMWNVTHPAEIVANGIKGKYGYVHCVAYSPDGKLLATVGQEGRLLIRDLATRKTLYEWAPTEDIRQVIFAPDGQYVAVGLGTGPVYVIRLPAAKK